MNQNSNIKQKKSAKNGKKKHSLNINTLFISVLNLSEQASLVLNSRGIIIQYNKICLEFFKIEPADLFIKNFIDFVREDSKKYFSNFIHSSSNQEMDNENDSIEHMRLPLLLKNNLISSFDLKIATIIIDNECFHILTLIDIVEKQREKAEKIMLVHAMKHINECLAILDLDGKIIFTNEAFNKTFKIQKNDLNGNLFSSLFTTTSIHPSFSKIY